MVLLGVATTNSTLLDERGVVGVDLEEVGGVTGTPPFKQRKSCIKSLSKMTFAEQTVKWNVK